MPNVSKIVVGDDYIDLTADTVTPEVLYEGYTAHAANGDIIVGAAIPGGDIEPWLDYIIGGSV